MAFSFNYACASICVPQLPVPDSHREAHVPKYLAPELSGALAIVIKTVESNHSIRLGITGLDDNVAFAFTTFI